jgi:CubicO group peptidase (beta-lactamase class C family)
MRRRKEMRLIWATRPKRGGKTGGRVRSLGSYLAVVLFICELTAPLSAQDLRQLTPQAAGEVADRHFNKATEAGGATVVTVVKGRDLVFMKGYGLANPKARTAVDPASTLFRIGSITKLFTAIAALRLIERGVIDPDKDVNTYLSKGFGSMTASRSRSPCGTCSR